MNETEYILNGLFAFGVGWFIAYLVRNYNRLWTKWGIFIGFVILLTGIIYSLFLSTMIADRNDVILSSLLALGFVIRFFKHRFENK